MPNHRNYKQRWFKSNPIPVGKTAKFDREAGTIKDVVLAQVGPAKGHGVHLEPSFISDTANYAVKNHEKNGLKSRFGHPSMSDTTMGTQLGYYKNFRIRDNQVIGDYQVLKAAKNSKNGDMWNWLFDMAEEKPDHVMNSIVFSPKGDYQYNEAGEKVWIWINKAYKDTEEFKNVSVVDYDNTKKVFVALGDLFFADMVEQGAATDNLLGAKFNQGSFAVQVNEFLNENPTLDNFIKENPDQIYTLLKQRGIEVDKTSWFSALKSLLGGNEEQVVALKAELATVISTAEKDKLNLETTVNTLTAASAAKDTEIASLQQEFEAAQARITELENMSVVEDKTMFKKKEKKPPRKYNAIEVRVQERLDKRNNRK